MTPDKISGSRLSVKVTPNAGRNEIIGFNEGVLRVKISAPPDKGKANKELIDFLSETLGIRKSSIVIIQGHSGRNKILVIEGLGPEEIRKRLQK